MSKEASMLLVSRLDALPGVTERLNILANLQVEPQREGEEQSYTHWNLLNEAFARRLPFGPELATAEAVCQWTKQQESKLELAHHLMDEREDDFFPEFPLMGVAACAAVYQDTQLLQRMFTERVIHLDGFSNAIFAILSVAGLLRTPKLVEMLKEWESVSVELFDVDEWEGLLQAALWTGDKEWADRCRAMIDNRLHWHEYDVVEKEGESFGAGPGDIIRSWRARPQA